MSALICIAGKNRIAVEGLHLAVGRFGKEAVVACVNRNDDGVSRWQPSLRHHATRLGVPVVTVDEIRAHPGLVFISLEFDRIIDPEQFASKRLYNFHFSLLPAYKGVYTAAWPILNGETRSGVTLHCIDAGIDTGDIIDQREIPIGPDDTARDLYFACMDSGIALLRQHLDALCATPAPAATPQPAYGSTYYSQRSIDYGALSIDFRQTAFGVRNQIRAFSFREFQSVRIDDLCVGRTEILPQRSSAPPGTVRRIAADRVVVSTIDYELLCHADRDAALLDCSRAGDTAGMRAALTLGANPAASDRDGLTPLLRACRNGEPAEVELLLAAGAAADQHDQDGRTALMYAVGLPESSTATLISQLLCRSGADARRPDAFGTSPLDVDRHGVLATIRSDQSPARGDT